MISEFLLENSLAKLTPALNAYRAEKGTETTLKQKGESGGRVQQELRQQETDRGPQKPNGPRERISEQPGTPPE